MPLPNSYAGAGLAGYPTQGDRSSDTPPFNPQESYGEITCEGTTVMPNIEAKIEKGFFLSPDNVWTCYRRNYFAVNVSYGLTPWIANSRLYLSQGSNKPPEQIQSMAVSLAAAVDGSAGKSIELIQHTPKRDKGPQMAMRKELLAPTPPGKSHEHSSYSLGSFHSSNQVAGPQLPLQNDAEPQSHISPTSHASSNYQHAFERIQFKSATANNGKRRAQQQYYHLIVELWANVQNPRDNDPRWVKVASRSSHPVVVRGRSPSHYQNEGPHGANASRGAGNGSMGGSGHHGLGSNGGGTYGGGYRNGLSGSGTSTMGGGVYRGTTYSLDPSPVGSHSVSSASSLSGGPVELVGDHQHIANEEDAKIVVETQHNYQYYPAPIYETIPSKVDATGLPGPDRKVKEEFPGPTPLSTSWQIGACGRFQGMETSRGYYPDVQAHVGY